MTCSWSLPPSTIAQSAAAYGSRCTAARSGEPALGPVAFPHRVSAMPNPLAPITHHWFDATHIAYGVVTGGVYGNRWKAEASLFNGREPDENRTDFDFVARWTRGQDACGFFQRSSGRCKCQPGA